MTMQTISVEIRRLWVKLANTDNGVLLQREQGDAVFYAYGEYAPHPDVEGMAEDAPSGPTRLTGGHIWIRSRNWSRVSVTPYDVNSEQPDTLIGYLPDLTTDDKGDVVESLNWLNAQKATKADVGDITTLTTPVKSSLVDALNDIEERLDTVNSERRYVADIVITSVIIADRGLTLPYTPIGVVQLLPYGGNWVYCTSSNSARTKNNSAVAAVAQSGDNWTYLKAQVNAAGTQTDIYLNNTLLGSITTNIPTGTARAFGAHFDITKSIGTTARTLNLDRVYQHRVRSDSESQNWRL